MAVKIGNAFITKLQMVSDGSFNIIEDFVGTAGAVRSTNLTPIIDTFTTVESTTWTAPTAVTRVEYLVVAGGGGGGNGYDNAGGAGGGAGMVLTGELDVTPGQSYTVTVGAGGNGGADTRANNAGSAGSNSVFGSITSLGGGG